MSGIKDEYSSAEQGGGNALTTTRSAGVGSLLEEHDQLSRSLKSRHIQFMALGGAIGTGLFVGSGAILALVGPAPLWLGYLSMMMLVWVVMNDLGEMATYLPLKGISIPYFVNRFVEPSLAFAAGWNYWYAYAILVAAEATAGAILLDYWETPVPTAVWITIILVVTLILNIIAVEVFGEAEFWFASIKLITIVGLVILGIVLMCGGGPTHEALGFKYWYPGAPGAFKEYMTGGNTGRFLAYWTAFVRAGFAFITSPELIALAAGETVAPRRNIPKAARRFIYRLAVFYGVSSLIIGDASASPWVIAIQNAGIGGLNHVINFCILTSAWSAGNAFLYSGSRILYSLSLSSQAPKFFAVTTKKGVPYRAVLATWLVGCLAYLNVSSNGATVFAWFSNISTISGFIAWIVCLTTYLRFRKAMQFNNLLQTMPFKTPLQPYASYVVLSLIIILTLTNGFQVFFPSEWSVSDFLAAYITIPIFLVLYLGHKIWFRTPLCRKIEDIDCFTGVKEMDELEAMDEKPIPKNWVQKVWFWIA
ncbi:proline-specific permease [Apiospora phragmitis]|uniref:Proline-specific permease n=1 Tax=Apiospora phragmitis TaxID=2905665 RepID=A0ABR1T8G6_9PEZI